MSKDRILLIMMVFSLRHLSAQWEILQTLPGCYAVDFVNDSTGLVVHNMIDGSYILKTVDYGVTWDTVAAYTPAYFFMMLFLQVTVLPMLAVGQIFS